MVNVNDDCSNGSIGSSASWEPCEDIWDEDQDVTAKRVEAERREVKKRTGKELWQIVRNNRRVIIGKSLRIEDIIMMSKRPWRKAPKAPFVAPASVEPKEEPKDVALNEDDELALVSLAPEMLSLERKSPKDSQRTKHRSKSRDGESSYKSRKSVKSSRRSESRVSEISSDSKSRQRSASSSRHSAVGESVVSELTTKSEASSKSPRRHTVPSVSSGKSLKEGAQVVFEAVS